MDSRRAKQIMQSTDSVQVLHDGSPVWIEKVMDNNTAEITYFESKKKEVVPVYMLVENKPASIH
jgi:small acid-soluble spore protein H (minor)